MNKHESKTYWKGFNEYTLYRKETLFEHQLASIKIYGEKPERRLYVAEYLSKLSPTNSLEIGCMFMNNSRNLETLNNINDKKCTYNGLDISELAIDIAAEENPYYNTFLEDIHIYNPEHHQKYDLVFSVGVLIHIPTEEIIEVASNLKKYSTKYIVHFEEHGEEFKKRNMPLRRYIANYKELYKDAKKVTILNAIDEGIAGGGVTHVILVEL